MPGGKILTLWMIRAAAALYVISVIGWLRGVDRMARLAWTAACLLYLAHAGFAFHFYHGWSHSAAYQETSRRTAQLLGAGWGGGLYVNYVFTVVWVVDAIWWWQGLDIYRRRPRWIQTSIHTFFAFMFFNATVVFGIGPVRWLGVVAAATLGLLWWKQATSWRQLAQR